MKKSVGALLPVGLKLMFRLGYRDQAFQRNMSFVSAAVVAFLFATFLSSCSPKAGTTDPLPSWNNTDIKQSIIEFGNKAVNVIPEEDRIAVFDMDGTILCERPLWLEMNAAVNGLNLQLAKDPSLIQYTEYQFAQKLAINPTDTTVTNHWSSPINYIDSMQLKAFAGSDDESYIEQTRKYLTENQTKDPRFKMSYAEQFYQPMLELLNFLKTKKFSIYIVSGSYQGLIWSVCPQVINFERVHLIGSRQIMSTQYDPANKKTRFVIQKGIYLPENDKDGKSLNIYSHIGKVPVFAFGNSMGDFGMFHLVSTSKYPHAVYLLNHDDASREYAYPPYFNPADSAWEQVMNVNGWKKADMSKEFKRIWMHSKK